MGIYKYWQDKWPLKSSVKPLASDHRFFVVKCPEQCPHNDRAPGAREVSIPYHGKKGSYNA